MAAGTENASNPAAMTGATVTARDLAPELLVAGRRRARPRASTWSGSRLTLTVTLSPIPPSREGRPGRREVLR